MKIYIISLIALFIFFQKPLFCQQNNNPGINLHSGGYVFGWNWYNKKLRSANRRASSGAVISGIEIEIPVYEFNKKLNLSSIIGYRHIYSNKFFAFEYDEDKEEVSSIPQINHSHFLNLGLLTMYAVNDKYSLGYNLDFLYFLEAENDIYMQQKIVSNLDLILRKKINSRLSIGIETPIRLLPYAKWDTNISIQFDEDGHRPNDPFEPVKVRIGAAGVSLSLLYKL